MDLRTALPGLFGGKSAVTADFEWSLEDERKHPRHRGKFARKSSVPAAGQRDLFADVPPSSPVDPRLAAAQERYDARGDLPDVAGSLFGGDDVRSRQRIGSLPDGTDVLVTEGSHAGKVGRLLHIQSLDGSRRLAVEIDDQTYPLAPTAVEPLDASLSWRTQAGAQPDRQADLFSASPSGTVRGVPVERLGLGRFRVHLDRQRLEGDQVQVANWIQAYGRSLASFDRQPTRFTGTKKDSLGRQRCYQSGKQIKCPSGAPTGPAPARTRDAAQRAVEAVAARPGQATPKALAKAEGMLAQLSRDDRRAVARALGLTSVDASRIVAEANRVLNERQRWDRQARAAGLDPAEMVAAARDARTVEREVVRQKGELLAEARKAYRERNGKALTRNHPAFRAGGDYTMLPGWDLIARDLAGRYPELLGAHGYEGNSANEQEAYQRLFDLVAEGPPKLRPWAEHYRQAIDSLTAAGPDRSAWTGRRTTLEEAPFADDEAGGLDMALRDVLDDLLAEGQAACSCGDCEECQEDADFEWSLADFTRLPARRVLRITGPAAALADLQRCLDSADFGWVQRPVTSRKSPSPNRYVSTGPRPKAGTVRYFKTPPKGVEKGEQPAGPPAEQPAEDVTPPVQPPAQPRPAEEKKSAMADLEAKLAERDARIAELEARLAELEARLGERAEPAPKPESKDEKPAPEAAYKQLKEENKRTGGIVKVPELTDAVMEAAWKAVQKAYKQLKEENKRTGGIVKVPELTDAVMEAVPGLSPGSLHKLLQDWQREGKLTLQLANDPRFESRRSEGIMSPRGLLFYVHLRDEQSAPPKPRSKDEAPPAPRGKLARVADAPREWNALVDASAELDREFQLWSTLPKVSRLIELMQERVPGLSKEDVHGLLQQAEREDRLTLQVVNDPHLDPDAARDAIQSPRGTLGYFYLSDASKLPETAPAPPKPRSKGK